MGWIVQARSQACLRLVSSHDYATDTHVKSALERATRVRVCTPIEAHSQGKIIELY